MTLALKYHRRRGTRGNKFLPERQAFRSCSRIPSPRSGLFTRSYFPALYAPPPCLMPRAVDMARTLLWGLDEEYGWIPEEMDIGGNCAGT